MQLICIIVIRCRRIAITLPGTDVSVKICWYRTALYLQHTVFSEV